MNTTRAKTVAKLKDKKYRDAFVRSQVNVGIPFQIRALRENPPRRWKQEVLAEKSNMLQPRISAMEKPGGSKLNLETLIRLASAFDVGLIVRFAPFSEMVDWSESFSPDSFAVPSFDNDRELWQDQVATVNRSFVDAPTGIVQQAYAGVWAESIALHNARCIAVLPHEQITFGGVINVETKASQGFILGSSRSAVR